MAILFLGGLIAVMLNIASCGGGEEEAQAILGVNTAPIADAGADQDLAAGLTVVLDGSGSTDVDGDALTFSWSLTPPAGSAATLSDPAAVKPTFDSDLPGIYVARLIVNDGTVDSAADTVSISTSNSAPVADAGADQTAFIGNTVTLDGSGSSDVNGDALTFSWSLTPPAGSAATLSDPAAVKPTFDIDLHGVYVAQLIVNDGTVDSLADSVSVSTSNSAPVANAGPDQTVEVGDTVILDGSTSTDADGDKLTFSWSLTTVPAGSAPTLSDPAAVNPTFDIDLPGIYVAQLIVNDSTVDSAVDTVSISTSNNAPVADAGADQTALVGDTVTLDGSGSSDADGDGLTYSWSLTPPANSVAALSDQHAINPAFDIDLPGIYVVQLIVNDGRENSAPDTVNISTINSAPVADAGTDQNAFVGDTVTLDGSASSDADGDNLTFNWSLTTVPATSAAMLSDQAADKPTFDIDLPGTYVAQLIVNDGNVNSAADTVTITAVNRPPVADAGTDQNVEPGQTVILDGGDSSDPDGDALTYDWDLQSKPAQSSSSFSSALENPSFTPDFYGSYTISLVVNDGTVDSLLDTVVVTASTAGQRKYDAACTSCHKVGRYDIYGSDSDLYDDGEKLRTDLSSIPGMKKVPDITQQELLDLNAFLEDPLIAP